MRSQRLSRGLCRWVATVVALAAVNQSGVGWATTSGTGHITVNGTTVLNWTVTANAGFPGDGQVNISTQQPASGSASATLTPQSIDQPTGVYLHGNEEILGASGTQFTTGPTYNLFWTGETQPISTSVNCSFSPDHLNSNTYYTSVCNATVVPSRGTIVGNQTAIDAHTWQTGTD